MGVRVRLDICLHGHGHVVSGAKAGTVAAICDHDFVDAVGRAD